MNPYLATPSSVTVFDTAADDRLYGMRLSTMLCESLTIFEADQWNDEPTAYRFPLTAEQRRTLGNATAHTVITLQDHGEGGGAAATLVCTADATWPSVELEVSVNNDEYGGTNFTLALNRAYL